MRGEEAQTYRFSAPNASESRRSIARTSKWLTGYVLRCARERPCRFRSKSARSRGSRAVQRAMATDDGAPDEAARAELIERFLPLARQLARRYQRGDEPLDDLIQVASLGLVKAIDRFDPSRDVAFSSFAVPTILGEIKRHFRDRTWSVRVPRDLQELTLNVDRAVTTLSHDLHRPPSVTEIAAAVEHERGAGARGARGVGRLPGYVAERSAQHRGRTARASLADTLGPMTTASSSPSSARRSTDCCRRSPRASARSCDCASRGPHAGGDRRAHRRLADAGLAPDPPDDRSPASRRAGSGLKSALRRECKTRRSAKMCPWPVPSGPARSASGWSASRSSCTARSTARRSASTSSTRRPACGSPRSASTRRPATRFPTRTSSRATSCRPTATS